MRRVGCVVLALGLVLVVTGCGSRPELDADRAHTLQQAVLGVSQAAADGRWDDAQALLTTTRTELDTGADLGEVTTARYRAIDTALDEVQGQLAAEQERQTAAAAAAAAAVPEQDAAPATVAPEPTVADTPATTPKGKGKNPGKGKHGKDG